MSDLVLDASAAVLALLVGSDAGADVRRRVLTSTTHAPHLLDAEYGHVLRRRVRAGSIDAATAERTIADLATLVDHRYIHAGPLMRAAWALRDNVSFYDALYVALAASLDAPLLTADARLARVPRLPCRVELC